MITTKQHKHADAIRFLTEDGIVCPTCGFNYAHMRGVKTIGQNDPGFPEAVENCGDIRAVEIDFQCENRCFFSVVTYQHKGINFLEVHEKDFFSPELAAAFDAAIPAPEEG